MTNEIKLAQYTDNRGRRIEVTADYYRVLEENRSQVEIAEFVYYRLYNRYIKPFKYPDYDYQKKYLSAFSIMANVCLLIETYESFRRGVDDSKNQSKEFFTAFFNREERFREFKNISNDFYYNIRCGLLHQGETKKGWVLTKKGTILFDENQTKINTILFADNLQKVLEEYKNELSDSDWDSEINQNCRVKINHIINNCSR